MDAFLVTVDHEEMVVTLRAGLKLPGTITSRKELTVILKENNVFKGIDNNLVVKAFEELKDLKEEKEYVVARGVFPVNGVDGKLDFHVNVSGKAEYNVDDKSKKIDYKDSVTIESVDQGAHLITIVPPTLGVDGYNLSGKLLGAKNGKEVSIVLSDGTEFNEDRTKVIATSRGRPVLSHGIFSVRSVYDVAGDVCYETGNVKFNGHVNISGNVLDEFKVEADSVEIHGVVGSAEIKTKGDLYVRGGINGKGKAKIICGGKAEVKYINAAYLEVKGDLLVQKEIVNSEVRSNGKVTSKKIIGGKVSGLKGIEAIQFGSEVGTPTIILPGMNYEVERINEAMRLLSSQIDTAIKPIKNSIGEREFYKKLDNDKKELVIKTYGYFTRLKKAYLKLIFGKDRIQNSEEFEPVREVVVLKRLYQDVNVKTEYCAKHFMVEVSGPIRIVEDMNNATMKTASLSNSDEKG